ncbi:lytic transglycosylase domain-containing protein [Zhongshania marina]|uniref:Lytic transglycosylase domain-containing protein n=1 Tax=Zhongshania marina TaxID=2304603 RepID=A0ABX9W7W0_9GAMM|nr:lytic transglycosylase domain-containing protein [Zhongshania marina]
MKGWRSALSKRGVLASSLLSLALIITPAKSDAAETSLASTTANPSAEQLEREELGIFLKQAIAEADSFKDRFDAEVWLFDMSSRMSRYIGDPQERLTFLRSVHREASAAGLSPELVLALIEVESYFDRFAVSRVGAQGLMQVMPFWKNEIGRPDDNLTNTDTNLRYGCQILQFYLQKEKGNLHRALARYNGSLGKSWYPERVFDRWRRHWYNGELKTH